MGHDRDAERPSSKADELAPEEARRIEQARERAGRGAERRELLTEASVSVAFVLVALAMSQWLGDGAPGLPLAAFLAAVCAVLVRVEFEVGEACTRPVQLVLPALLLLLPAGDVPLVVALAHVAARLPDVARGRVPAERVLLCVADSWFCVAPALLVGLVGIPSGAPAQAALAAAAFATQLACDFAAAAVRFRVGIGSPVRSLVRPMAWVSLVDLLLTPVAVVVALAARAEPLAVAGVVPLAALLAVFARERRGRIENALELHRVTEETKERLQSIVRNASDLIAIVRPDGTIKTLTGSVASVFGPGWREAEGTSLLEHVHPDDAAPVAAFLAGAADKGAGESHESEWRIRYADGSWRHVAAAATNLLADPRVEGLVVTARNVDERKALEEQLRHRAFHDPLTALANRALFYDRIEHALSRRGADDRHVAVVYVDLDDFKPLNDRHGHGFGDELLVEVAHRLSARVRAADTVARLGGDEFGVLLEAVSGPNEPVQTAERLRDAIAEPFAVGGELVSLSASLGVALTGAGGHGVDELLRKADLAMYAAKRNGKGRLELYREAFEGPAVPAEGRASSWFRTGDEQREEVLSILARDDAPTIVFQPIADLRTGRVAGYEALSRFPDAQERPPDAWFAQAHRCGLGPDLEAKALARALTAPDRPAGTYLTLNLSPSSLAAPAVARVLPARLDELVIEVTENEVIADDPEIVAVIAALRERGARLAVDDTGSGYAGLTHVMRLAPDVIKLDRSLVAGVHGDPVKAALIESFVRYARQIDATVCAEGIETLDDLTRLADLDVAYGQGWAIGRPAAPWPGVAEEAGETCRRSLSAALDEPRAAGGHDAGLELLTLRLSRATCAPAITEVLGAVARELRADSVLVATRSGEVLARDGGPPALPAPNLGAPEAVVQLLAGDPHTPAPLREAMLAAGLGSCLRVPVRSGERHLGALQVACTEERAWSRHEIRRARIISHALGAALGRLEGPVLQAA
jgi:diguanylate cyclase (GGDEF)-like protein/PAS domain S-box-containing protein